MRQDRKLYCSQIALESYEMAQAAEQMFFSNRSFTCRNYNAKKIAKSLHTNTCNLNG